MGVRRAMKGRRFWCWRAVGVSAVRFGHAGELEEVAASAPKPFRMLSKGASGLSGGRGGSDSRIRTTLMIAFSADSEHHFFPVLGYRRGFTGSDLDCVSLVLAARNAWI